MPKSKDKTKGAPKRRKAPSNSGGSSTVGSSASSVGSTRGGGGAGTSAAKPIRKASKKKVCLDDGIAMSKQLASKVQRVRSTRPRQTRSNAKESAPRLCGNGKPMPCLADLEKMYEDSDTTEGTDTEDKHSMPATHDEMPERCTTPVGQITDLPSEKLMSPTTLKKIAAKIAPIVIDMLETIDIDDDGPPHEGICPPKKRKKPNEPYIVGCKDRDMIDRPFRSKVGVGDTKYGVECHCNSDDEDETCCKSKRCKRRGDGAKISKSRFNPQSEEIASYLKRNESLEMLTKRLQNFSRVEGSTSPDSCDTVNYEYTENVSPTYSENVSTSGSNTRPFSPVASTSRDHQVFLINAQLLNESLVSNNSSMFNDVEIIDVPMETIVVDDTANTPKPSTKAEPDIEDDCIFVDSLTKKNNISLIDLDEPKYDYYNNLDTFNIDDSYNNDDCQIIDVDNILAHSTAVVKKFKKDDSLDVVTFVDPNATMPRPVKEAQNNIEIEVLISSSTLAGPVRGAPSTSGITGNLNPVRDSPQQFDGNSTIADVVTKFFSNPNSASANNSLETIDLTKSNFIETVTSWMSVLYNFVRAQTQPRETPPVQNPNDGVIVNNGPANSTPLNRERSRNVAHPSNVVSVPPANNIVTVVTSPAPVNSARSARTIECPICMDTLSTSIASTMCGHVFCMLCIKAAIRANGKKCPTCRKKLTGAGYHQLFL